MMTYDLTAAYAAIPEGWFLYRLNEIVAPVLQEGDVHHSTGRFNAELQWRDGGGRLVRSQGSSPGNALLAATAVAHKRTP